MKTKDYTPEWLTEEEGDNLSGIAYIPADTRIDCCELVVYSSGDFVWRGQRSTQG